MYDVSVSTSENGKWPQNQCQCQSPIDAQTCRLGGLTRREELGRAAERAGPVAVAHALLAEPEISDLDVTLRVEQEVVELQIPAKS